MMRWLCATAALLISGCTGYQLKSNTLDVADTIEDLYTTQALTNIERFIDNPDSIPAQADITTGNVQTNGALQLSAVVPYGNQVTEGAASSTGVTSIVGGVATPTTIQLPARTITPQIADGWQQSWTITPVSDANTLRHLRALYTYVTTKSSDDPEGDLFRDYDLNTVITNDMRVLDSSRVLAPRCVICLKTDRVDALIEHFRKRKLHEESEKVRSMYDWAYHDSVLTRFTSKGSGPAADAGKAIAQTIVNEYAATTNNFSQIEIEQGDMQLQRPFQKFPGSFEINPKLVEFRKALCWTSVSIPLATVGQESPCQGNGTLLARYLKHSIWLDKSKYPRARLSDFVLFLVPQSDSRVSVAPTGGSSGSGG